MAYAADIGWRNAYTGLVNVMVCCKPKRPDGITEWVEWPSLALEVQGNSHLKGSNAGRVKPMTQIYTCHFLARCLALLG